LPRGCFRQGDRRHAAHGESAGSGAGVFPGITGPGALWEKLNQVLCGSVAPGKFVTLFYGVIDSETLTLRFENAGHCWPIVLRGDSALVLTEGSTVLGLFPQAEYEERRFVLQSADCLLLTTDGVTEAANEGDEEFGAERVTASARAARSLARTASGRGYLTTSRVSATAISTTTRHSSW